LKLDGAPRAKLRMAKTLWRSFQPGSSVSGGRITDGDFSFYSERTLGDGVKVGWSVRAWKVDDVSCSLRVRMGLYDERVSALRSIAMGFDMSRVGFLDFDVLATSSVMDGQEMPDPPVFDSEVQAEEFAPIVEGYSRRIDRIWDFVGGVSVQGLENLAIWAMRNRDRAGTMSNTMGDICAAFVYGERQLAYELIAELRSQWERRVQQEPRQAVFEVYDAVRLDIERLQDAVRLH
jgi:hypothetical protein